MSLALRLGRTLHELNQTLTASELQMWLAYDQQSPIGDCRSDWHAAQITAAAFNSQGANASVADFLPQWGRVDEAETVVDESQFETLFEMMAQ